MQVGKLRINLLLICAGLVAIILVDLMSNHGSPQLALIAAGALAATVTSLADDSGERKHCRDCNCGE